MRQSIVVDLSKWRSLAVFLSAIAIVLAVGSGCPDTTAGVPDDDSDLDAGSEDAGDAGGDDTSEEDADGSQDTIETDDADGGDTSRDADTGSDDATDEFEPSEGMAWVPAGAYRRGCDPELDDDCSILGSEEPAHEVFVSDFEIDIHPVTEAEYTECVDAGECTPAHYDGDRSGELFPVVNVSSEQALPYCEWVDKRLPTEAEWEKAARGTDERIYPWGDSEPDCTLANFDACGEEIEAVGQSPDGSSPYGVEDMTGNVRNWAYDLFDGDYYEDSPYEDPMGPVSGETRAVRGGSWFHDESLLRASSRHSMEAPGYGPETGFRCARRVEP